jgi:GAF domain-containing protein
MSGRSDAPAGPASDADAGSAAPAEGAALADYAAEHLALRRVAELVASGVREGELFAAVAVEASRLIREDTTLLRVEGEGVYSSVAVCGGSVPVGTRFAVASDDEGLLPEIARTRRPARGDDYIGRGGPAYARDSPGLGSAAGVPVIVGGRMWGVLCATTTDGRRLPPDTENRLAQFAELVAAALANAQDRSDLQRMAEEQAALRQVAELAAQAAPTEEIFAAVTVSASHLLDDAPMTLTRFGRDDELVVLATHGGPTPIGTFIAYDPDTLPDRVRSGSRAVRVDDYAGELDADLAARFSLAAAVSVPVSLGSEVWGMLTATSAAVPLPAGTEERLLQFAGLVTVALSSVQARTELQKLADEQAALRSVAELAVQDVPAHEVLAAVARQASRLTDVDFSTLLRFEPDGSTEIAALDGAPPGVAVGMRAPATGDGATQRVWRTGRPARIDNLAESSAHWPQVAHGHGFNTSAAVPILTQGTLWGVLVVVGRDRPLPEQIHTHLTSFAELAATAIAAAQSRRELQQLAEEQSALRSVAERLAREQAALLRVAQLVARGTPEAELFDAVAIEASGLIGGEGANLVRFDGPRTFTIIATCGGPAPVGLKVEIPEDDDGTASEVIRTHRTARRDNYRTSAAPLFTDVPYAQGSSVSVPIIVEGRLWGLLGCVIEGRRLPTGTEYHLQQFAELVAAAIANSQARAEVQQLADEQSALLRVAELVARGASGPELFDAVAAEAARLINNEATTLVRYEGNQKFTIIATRGGPVPVGTSVVVPPDDEGTMNLMLREKRPNRLDDYPSAPGPHFSRERYGVGSSVSVPILVEGELWGMLGCLTEGRRLPADTEDRLLQFAELVTAAIANSQARAEMQHLANDQAAFRRVAELVARDAPLDQVFAEVSTETSRVLGGTAAAMLRFDPDGFAVVVATHDCPAVLGLRIPIDNHFDAGGLFSAGRPFRTGSFEHSDLAEVAGEIGITAGAAAPIIVEGGLWGVLTTGTSNDPQPSNSDEQIEQFAALSAVAITNAENKAKLTASRARVVATADETRHRLQRDVHDGAQQRLVQTVITLKLGRDAAAMGAPTAELINEALRHAERANSELRELVHGILPASLSQSGLQSGLESLIADITMPVRLEFSAPRLPTETETTAYFIVAEALANVVKHAAASLARVHVSFDAPSLIIEVSDDGVGGADATRGSGLTGLQDRADAAGGTLTIASDLGAGTILRASLPVDIARPSP